MTDLVLFPTLIAAFATMLFGSVAAALITHLLTSFRTDREYRLRKLEELYAAVASAVRNLRANYHYMSEVAGRVLKWADAMAMGNVQMIDFQREQSTAIMIANVYFPDLVFVLDRLEDLDHAVQLKKEAFSLVQKDWAKFPIFEAEFDTAREEMIHRQQEAFEKIFEQAKAVRRGKIINWLRSSFFD